MELCQVLRSINSGKTGEKTATRPLGVAVDRLLIMGTKPGTDAPIGDKACIGISCEDRRAGGNPDFDVRGRAGRAGLFHGAGKYAPVFWARRKKGF